MAGFRWLWDRLLRYLERQRGGCRGDPMAFWLTPEGIVQQFTCKHLIQWQP